MRPREVLVRAIVVDGMLNVSYTIEHLCSACAFYNVRQVMSPDSAVVFMSKSSKHKTKMVSLAVSASHIEVASLSL